MNQRVRIDRKQKTAAAPVSTESELRPSLTAPEQMTEEAPPVVQEVLSSHGQPLDSATRDFMEPRFGHDFSKVRVHTDERAVESAQAVDALAYTVGQDMVFSSGQYAPETGAGQQLLAHELTHVVQQHNGSAAGPLAVGPADDSYEQEASMMSAAIASNVSPTVEGVAGEANRVQRTPGDVSLNLNSDTMHTTTAGLSRSDTGLLIQRKPLTTEQRLENLEQRVDDLEQDKQATEKHQKAQDIQQKATALDLLWRTKFDKQFSSYNEAILRISGGLQAATTGFQEAQAAQAETEAMVWGVFKVMLTMAGGFEWAFVPALGKLGIKSEEVAEHVLSAGHALADVTVDAAKESASKKAETPATASIPGFQAPAGAAGGDPLAFLTSNAATLENYRQGILDAFINHLTATQGYSDEDWLDTQKFNLQAQEQLYSQLLDNLQQQASDADKLKPDTEIARVLERHLWAYWITEQAEQMDKDYKEMGQYQFASLDIPGETRTTSELMFTPGADIEKRLNKLNIDDRAGVSLSGHWYSSNSPDNWSELLVKWARDYAEGRNAEGVNV